LLLLLLLQLLLTLYALLLNQTLACKIKQRLILVRIIVFRSIVLVSRL